MFCGIQPLLLWLISQRTSWWTSRQHRVVSGNSLEATLRFRAHGKESELQRRQNLGISTPFLNA